MGGSSIGSVTVQVGPFALLQGSLVITKHAPIEEWEKAAKTLFNMQKHSPWWIADMLNFAENQFGEEMWQLVPEDTSESFVGRLIGVGKKYPVRDRETTLSYTHHQMALRIQHPQLRRAILLRAANERINTEDFGRIIKEALE